MQRMISLTWTGNTPREFCWEWPTQDTILLAASREVAVAQYVMPHVKGRDLAVQAGTGMWVYPLLLAEEFRKVITFEINAENVRCAKVNMAGVENIELHKAAIGNSNVMRKLVQPYGNNYGSGYLEGDGDIKTIRLDDLELPACDLIWLDIQGHESEAVLGAMETIRRYHPVVVLEEDNLPYMKAWGVAPDTAGKFLLAEGYRKHPRRFGNDQMYL